MNKQRHIELELFKNKLWMLKNVYQLRVSDNLNLNPSEPSKTPD